MKQTLQHHPLLGRIGLLVTLFLILTGAISHAQDTTLPVADDALIEAAYPEAVTEEAVAEVTEAEEVAMLTQEVADIIWLVLAAALVFLMQAGFAMVETVSRAPRMRVIS